MPAPAAVRRAGAHWQGVVRGGVPGVQARPRQAVCAQAVRPCAAVRRAVRAVTATQPRCPSPPQHQAGSPDAVAARRHHAGNQAHAVAEPPLCGGACGGAAEQLLRAHGPSSRLAALQPHAHAARCLPPRAALCGVLDAQQPHRQRGAGLLRAGRPRDAHAQAQGARASPVGAPLVAAHVRTPCCGPGPVCGAMAHAPSPLPRPALQNKPFDEPQLRRWMAQLLLALDYLEQQQVLHRDVKTGNIFLCAEGHVQVRHARQMRCPRARVRLAHVAHAAPCSRPPCRSRMRPCVRAARGPGAGLVEGQGRRKRPARPVAGGWRSARAGKGWRAH